MALLIKNGTICHKNEQYQSDILIEDGIIKAIGLHLTAPEGSEVYDATGKHILPGLIDGHVHFRDPGLTYKEDFTTGSTAAIHGGVTGVLDMPNVIPITNTAERLIERAHEASRRCLVNIRFFALLTEDNLDEMEGMAKAGAVGFKLFLGTSTGNVACPRDGILLEQFKKAAELHLPIAVHAENNGINAYLTKQYQEQGIDDPAILPKARPAFSEIEAVGKAIAFAKATGAALHICHVSTAGGLDLVRKAKAEGLPVTCETAPQYLLLNDTAYLTKGPTIKAFPTIKSESDRLALWKGIQDGTIDFLATDHAPHTPEEKQGNIWTVTGGISGVEILLPLMLTEFNRGTITMEQLLELLCYGTARVWKLSDWVSLTPGKAANLAIVDLHKEWVISPDVLHGKNNVTAFAGTPVTGKALATVVNGKLYRF